MDEDAIKAVVFVVVCALFFGALVYSENMSDKQHARIMACVVVCTRQGYETADRQPRSDACDCLKTVSSTTTR